MVGAIPLWTLVVLVTLPILSEAQASSGEFCLATQRLEGARVYTFSSLTSSRFSAGL